ncbi:hypothetical protein QOZ80_6AG0525930 [Eleusine coracana subsp. coracana]|nr:hypothetical protein QOZ80_6AG0525930 [Eleusine coracana subsp. coracana]
MGLRPRCDTWCGHVRVPYPFGISLNCSYPAPGFNLTCDRSTHPPRLLLGDGTLHVDEISLLNSTVRVVSTGGVRIGRDGIGMWRGAGMVDDDAGPFALMSGDFNELVVTGCNVQATVRVGNDTVVSGCSSFCSSGANEFHYGRDGSKYCSGIGCCQAPIPVGDTSLEVRFQRLDDDDPAMRRLKPVHVFVAEVDWFDHKVGRDILRPNPKRGDRGSIRVPVILQWAIWPLEVETAASAADTVFPPPCDAAVARNICRSEHSFCTDTGRGYQCSCKDNYQGNPYLVGGCVDVNECELPPEDSGCFGDCTNTDGGFHCRCPRGTHGDPTIPRGCTRYITGLTIGLLAASGPAFLILVLIVIIVLQGRHCREDDHPDSGAREGNQQFRSKP